MLRMASFDDAEPMDVVSFRGAEARASRHEASLWSGATARCKDKQHLEQFFRYILNNVKHIQDYYAPIVGEFEHVVLLALVRLGNGAYGASIRREIRERTGRDAAGRRVYMTLERLEKKGMIVSYVGDPTAQRGGRRRRHYLIDTRRREGARPRLPRVHAHGGRDRGDCELSSTLGRL